MSEVNVRFYLTELQGFGPDVCIGDIEPGWWHVYGVKIDEDRSDDDQAWALMKAVSLRHSVSLEFWGDSDSITAARASCDDEPRNMSTHKGLQAVQCALLAAFLEYEVDDAKYKARRVAKEKP